MNYTHYLEEYGRATKLPDLTDEDHYWDNYYKNLANNGLVRKNRHIGISLMRSFLFVFQMLLIMVSGVAFLFMKTADLFIAIGFYIAIVSIGISFQLLTYMIEKHKYVTKPYRRYRKIKILEAKEKEAKDKEMQRKAIEDLKKQNEQNSSLVYCMNMGKDIVNRLKEIPDMPEEVMTKMQGLMDTITSKAEDPVMQADCCRFFRTYLTEIANVIELNSKNRGTDFYTRIYDDVNDRIEKVLNTFLDVVNQRAVYSSIDAESSLSAIDQLLSMEGTAGGMNNVQ